jgi:hypothetical protein
MVAAMPALDPRDRVQRFVLRARRVMAHSLVRERLQLLNDLASGTVKVRVLVDKKTGDSEHRMMMELPSEEAFESFAARLRPFTMRRESVYWELVLDGIEALVSEETKTEVIDIEDLRDHWRTVVEGAKMAQAYYVMTESGQLSDVQLADLWLNSDALHTQPIQSVVGKSVSLNQRHQAAVGVYARIGACVNHTYFMVNHLVNEGLLELDQEVFKVPVLADTTIDFSGQIYSAELGAELPTDLSSLDPNVWRPIHEDIELLPDPEDSSPGGPKA